MSKECHTTTGPRKCCSRHQEEWKTYSYTSEWQTTDWKDVSGCTRTTNDCENQKTLTNDKYKHKHTYIVYIHLHRRQVNIFDDAEHDKWSITGYYTTKRSVISRTKVWWRKKRYRQHLYHESQDNIEIINEGQTCYSQMSSGTKTDKFDMRYLDIARTVHHTP